MSRSAHTSGAVRQQDYSSEARDHRTVGHDNSSSVVAETWSNERLDNESVSRQNSALPCDRDVRLAGAWDEDKTPTQAEERTRKGQVQRRPRLEAKINGADRKSLAPRQRFYRNRRTVTLSLHDTQSSQKYRAAEYRPP